MQKNEKEKEKYGAQASKSRWKSMLEQNRTTIPRDSDIEIRIWAILELHFIP